LIYTYIQSFLPAVSSTPTATLHPSSRFIHTNGYSSLHTHHIIPTHTVLHYYLNYIIFVTQVHQNHLDVVLITFTTQISQSLVAHSTNKGTIDAPASCSRYYMLFIEHALTTQNQMRTILKTYNIHHKFNIVIDDSN